MIYTVGHSSRTLEEFIDLLAAFKITILADIRRFPGSDKFPHFNQTPIQEALAIKEIEYLWLEDLGGRRYGKNRSSPNIGLKNAGFRNYADYMLTEPFRQAVDKLISLAEQKTAAVMCAERCFWKCHRCILSDYFIAQGIEVIHLLEKDCARRHALSGGAVITEHGQVLYMAPAEEKTLFDL